MKILVLPGDGIGPEITQATLAVLNRANEKFKLGLEWDQRDIGLTTLKKVGSTLPDDVMEAARKAPGIILGPVDHLIYPSREKGGINPSGELRVKLDLFANIRPAKSRMGVGLTGKPIDRVIFRECTEGFYADRNIESGSSEMLVTPDVVISLRRITRLCCERIARSAFELAMTRSKHVSIVHKANVLKIGDGMFIDICHEVGQAFPEVRVDDFIVDAMMAHVVRAPERFDVIVTTNMFGDILSDLTAELSGSLGLGGSLNAGAHHAMGQAAHGSAPDIAGQNIANPLSLILSAGMLLSWYGQRKGLKPFEAASAAIEQVAAAAVSAREATRDVGGKLGTRETGQAFAARLLAS